MTLGSSLLIVALLLLVAGFIARPLFTGFGHDVTDAERQRSELLAARDRTLSSLADLDMDMALEKIPEQDYAAHRAELVQLGADILRQLDAVNGGPAGSGAPQAGGIESDLEDELEAAVSRLRRGADPDLEADMEAAVARLRQTPGLAQDGFCPQCGQKIAAEDRFCTRCGAPLEPHRSGS